MKAKKTIALCIPAYNAAAYLPRLLRSAASQKIPFDEILVYNDCSADNTAEVAEAHGAKVISGKRNVGCSAGKNALLRECSSEWIHFHDADDILLNNFTEEAFRWIDQSDPPDVVVMGFEYRDYETNELLSIGLLDNKHLQKDPLEYSICNKIPNFGIYKKATLLKVGGFDEDKEILFNEDVAFHTKLATAKLRFRASNKITSINYRYKKSMSSANQYKCLKAQIKVMEGIATNTNGKYAKAIASKIWQSATGLAVLGKWDDVNSALEAAHLVYPKQPEDLSKSFALLLKITNPKTAFWLREILIRIFKPKCRK